LYEKNAIAISEPDYVKLYILLWVYVVFFSISLHNS